MNSKKKLEIYYFLNNIYDASDDIEKCLKLNLDIKLTDYEIIKFNKFINDKIYDTSDTIKNGLLLFNDMYRKLKLKSSNETWFVYISNGDIKEIYKNISVILINKTPIKKECVYIINKRNLNISINMIKNEKLSILKEFSKTLQELLFSNKIKSIKYDNLI